MTPVEEVNKMIENLDELGTEGYAEKKSKERREAVKEVAEAYNAIFKAKQGYTNALWRARELGVSMHAMANTIGISEAAVRTWMRRNHAK